MKPMYYYERFHSKDEIEVQDFIALYVLYQGEEGLMRLIENDIHIVDDLNELEQYCNEYGYEYEELKEMYDE